MDALKQSLAALTYVDQRKKTALITELLPAIESTHKMGFSLARIHAEIATVIPMPYATFASCLHRTRKTKKTEPPNNEITIAPPTAASHPSTPAVQFQTKDEKPSRSLTQAEERTKRAKEIFNRHKKPGW